MIRRCHVELKSRSNLHFEYARRLMATDLKSEWDTARPYTEIPGPKSVFELRQFFAGGKYYGKSIKELHIQFNAEYGDLVKIKGLFGRKDFLMTFDPNDFEMLFRTEGIFPKRPVFDTFKYFRKHIRPEIYSETGGLLAEHGEKWATFRKRVNPVMLQPKTTKQYVTGMDEIAVEFIEKIKIERNADNQVSSNFIFDVNLWALESIAYVALDARLNALNKLDTNSDAFKLITSVRSFVNLSYKLDVETSIWKYVRTPMFVRQMKTLNDLTNLVMKYVETSIKNLQESENSDTQSKEESVLQKLLKINRATGIVMAADMLLAGSDTTGSLAMGFLYRLARHPDKQQKLREEIFTILPHKHSKLSQDSMNNIPYLKACLKEVARLQSVVSGNVRETGQDLIFQGYQVPKGTEIATCNMFLHFKDNIFPKANEFIPERWLVKDNENSEFPSSKTAHPFAYLPFGFGARSCIGRRFAELEIACLIARIVRNFHLEWNSEVELKYKSDILNVPTGDTPFRFIDIHQ